MSERILPHDMDAEASVLGAVLLDRQAINRVAEFLRSDDFYHDQHAQVYRACLALNDQGSGLDVLTVGAELKRMKQFERIGGEVFLAELEGGVPTAANVEHYGRLVKDAALKRGLIASGTRIVALGFDQQTTAEQAADQAQASLFAAVDGRAERGFVSLKDAIPVAWEAIERAHKDGASVSGVPSGFVDLDHKTGGFQPSNLIVIAARPGMGKTSFCLNVAEHVAVTRKLPVAIFSLEMSQQELVNRLLCSRASIDAWALRTGLLKDAEWTRLAKVLGELAEAAIWIDESPVLSLMELRAKARRMKATSGLGLVIVDYLQLLEGRTKESREREVADVSRSLKGLARELDVPIIACSQLNREAEKRTEHRPQLSDLRDSGAVEQDADLVMFIYREKLYGGSDRAPDVAEVIVAKHRNGPVGTVKLLFLPHLTRFVNMRRPEGSTAPIERALAEVPEA